MKQISLLLFVLVALQAKSTTRTVSNNPSTIAQFNTIQAAIEASDNGDTVYVHGSPNNYAQFLLEDKRLTIIGPGWAPDKNLPLQAIVAGCILRNTNNSGTPSGSEIQGLIFIGNANLNSSATLTVNNLRIIRCQFNSSVSFDISASGNLLEGNLFLTTINFAGSATYENFLFQNNVFFSNTCCTSTGINGLTNSLNVRFDHNLFYSDNGVIVFGSNCRFLTLSNNIFVERNPAANLSSSTFNNNITFNCGEFGDTAWIRNGNVDAGGNVASKNPQMVEQSQVNAGTFSGLLNFTIPTGPANNSGSDSKDMGLLYDATGSLNWNNSRGSRLPYIFSMNITTPTVAPGGNINVTVEARKNN